MFVRAYMYFEEGWVGSGVAYHPHMFTFYPDDHVAADGGWPSGLGFLTTYLSVRSELTTPYIIRPFFALQDGRRVNTDYGDPPMDLTKITEYRSVNHCNGCAAGQDCGTSRGCDNWGGGNYYSINYWRITDAEIPKGEWAKCEWYVKMNTVDSVGRPDGILRIWVNDNIVYNSDRMLYRTAQNPKQAIKQVKITPYIGVGSPKDQTMWIDDFVVYDYNVKN